MKVTNTIKQASVLVYCLLTGLISAANFNNDVMDSIYKIVVSVNNKDTGTIELLYPEGSKTALLKNGKAGFLINIKEVCQMRLLTKHNIVHWDEPSIITFLAEPSDITISFSLVNDTPVNIHITGSKIQAEYENWQKKNAILLNKAEKNWSASSALMKRIKDNDNIEIRKKVDELNAKSDSIYKMIEKSICAYVNENRESNLSGYLLFHYRKKMNTDSLLNCYLKLPSSSKQNQFAKVVFDYLFIRNNNGSREPLSKTLMSEFSKAKSFYDFSLSDLNNRKIKLSDFKGKPTFLFFWATWCGGCHKAAPDMKSLINSFKNSNINFISVSIDTDYDMFIKSKRKIELPCTTLIDTQNTLRYYFQFLYVPHIIVLDAAGKIVYADKQSEEINTDYKVLVSKVLKEHNKNKLK